jgi:hypothetical protein
MNDTFEKVPDSQKILNDTKNSEINFMNETFQENTEKPKNEKSKNNSMIYQP